MRKILNPLKNTANGNCFGCSQENANGLQMEFFEDGENVICNWKPKQHFAGFNNVLHGGIQTTLMDEIACWVVFTKLGTSGVTTSLNAKFNSTVFTDRGNITIKAKLIKQARKIALIHTEITDAEGNICTEAEVEYRIFPAELAKKRLAYPGVETFFDAE